MRKIVTAILILAPFSVTAFVLYKHQFPVVVHKNISINITEAEMEAFEKQVEIITDEEI